MYKDGKNVTTDGLSRSLQGAAPPQGIAGTEIQVSLVGTNHLPSTSAELSPNATSPAKRSMVTDEFIQKGKIKDPHLQEVVAFLERGVQPADELRARKTAT